MPNETTGPIMTDPKPTDNAPKEASDLAKEIAEEFCGSSEAAEQVIEAKLCAALAQLRDETVAQRDREWAVACAQKDIAVRSRSVLGGDIALDITALRDEVRAEEAEWWVKRLTDHLSGNGTCSGRMIEEENRIIALRAVLASPERGTK